MTQKSSIEPSEEKEMTSEERLNYLVERGILVETPEDRRRKQIIDIMNEKDQIDDEEYEDLTVVLVPSNESLPLKEIAIRVPTKSRTGDILLEELKPFVKALSKRVDLSLLKDQSTKTFGSNETPQVSEKALLEVADQGNIEVFPLVKPMASNKFIGVNIYLDEIGMLKRLPLNKRAASFAAQAGFNPPPSFYGDVFIGRVTSKPSLKNLNFKLGIDTSADTAWLQAATMQNLEYQTQMNQITGKDEIQPSLDGENGIAKDEEGYSWTQTEEEVELVVPIKSDAGEKLSPKEVKSIGIHVKFFTNKIYAKFGEREILSLSFFANIDPDGSTWTLDNGAHGTSLVITCEKGDAISWPRITN
jgi:hypothetical protein